MDKRAVSDALEEAATLMELGGENPFRVRAYRNASRTVRGLTADLAGDGSSTMEEMIDKARKLGFSYLGITEHSQSARYARGLDPERLREEWEGIDRINAGLEDFTVLKGIESDILPDGSLDYPDDILASFDFVMGSVHSGFTMPEDRMTERICPDGSHRQQESGAD